MRESAMRQRVVKLLRPLDAISVENPSRPGTPDVNFIEGWLELKVLEKWPVRAKTKVRVPCFTQQQRVWLKRRWLAGGGSWLLICIGKDWVLLNGDAAAESLGNVDKETLLGLALIYSEGSLDEAEVYKALKLGRSGLPTT